MNEDPFDRELAGRLAAYESRLPDAPPPAADSPPRGGTPRWPLVGVGALAAVAAVLAVAVLLGGFRDDTGEAGPSPSAAATAAAQPTASASEQPVPESPSAAVPATGAPSPGPSDTPAFTAGVSWTRLAQLRTDGEDLSPSGLASRDDGLMVLVGTAILADEAQPDLPAPRQGRIWLSSDGVRWEAIVDAETFRDAVLEAILVASDGTFVALGWLDPVGGTITQHVAWQSVDGRDWEQVDLGLPSDLTTSARTIAQGPAGFVIAGTRINGGGNQVWHSSDGRSWRLVREFSTFENPEGRDIQQVRGGAEGFVATGVRTEGRLYVMASGDGIEWLDAPEQASVDGMPAVPPLAPLGGDWVATGRGGVDPIEIWRSANGLDWSAVEGVEPAGAGLEIGADLLGAGDRLFLESSEAFVPGPTWTSTDGRAWVLTDLPIEAVPVLATALDDGYLMVGMEPNEDANRSIGVWSSVED